MKIYTKTGDKGTTSLIGGQRVSKAHVRIEAYGTIDELMAHIGLLHELMENDDVRRELIAIENDLMTLSSLLASDGSSKKLPPLSPEHVRTLERLIDAHSSEVPPADRFTLPVGDKRLSMSHICRTVCRRAERRVVEVMRESSVDENIPEYLNRLSDYFYLLGRKMAKDLLVKEIFWEPGK